MKMIQLSLAVAALAAFTFPLHAESSVTLTGVHNCCKSCVKGIEKAITGAGATAAVDGEEVVITASNEANVKKATEALLAAGYYGEGAELAPVKDAKVKSATVGTVHLCCGKCVTAVETAVKSVAGVTSHTAEKNVETFTVEGDFSTKELAEALNKAGFNGTIK